MPINISDSLTHLSPPRGALGQELKVGDTILFFTLKYSLPRVGIIKHIEITDRSAYGWEPIVSYVEVLIINPISARRDYEKDTEVRCKNGYTRYILNWSSAFTLDSRGMIIQNEPIEMDLRGKEATR
jgi:hypothetical protein